MIPFIDIHCHLDYMEQPHLAVQRAREEDVRIVLTNWVNPATNRKRLELAKTHPEERAAKESHPALLLREKGPHPNGIQSGLFLLSPHECSEGGEFSAAREGGAHLSIILRDRQPLPIALQREAE